MSADNWTVCPRCVNRTVEAIREKERAVEDAYGKVPLAEWQALKAEASAIPQTVKETFREDYEIGLDGTKFSIRYYGGCSVCDLSVTFQHDAEVEA